MSKRHSRHLLFNVNQFQARLLYPILFFCIVAFILLSFNLLYVLSLDHRVAALPDIAYVDHVEAIVPWYYDFLNYRRMAPWLVGISALMICFMVFWIYYVSNRIVGPYERIVRELDEILEGGRKEPLILRHNDDMFKELLDRINKLVEKK